MTKLAGTDLAGKTAIVTGAANGIGRAIALRLGKLGANVVVADIDYDGLAETVASINELGGSALGVKTDVSSVAAIDALFVATLDRYKQIDIVVADAGLQGNFPVVDVTEADFDRIFGVNVKGSYFTLQRAARHVADSGRIIYVGSSTSCFPMKGHGLYGTSKVPCKFLVEVLAKELGHRKVTVNSILPTVTLGGGPHAQQLSPGAAEFVRTHNPQQRPGSVEDAADACEYLVSDLAAFISGQHLLLSAGGPA